MGNFELAEVILHKSLQSLKIKGYISAKFTVNIERLADLYVKSAQNTINIEQEFA